MTSCPNPHSLSGEVHGRGSHVCVGKVGLRDKAQRETKGKRNWQSDIDSLQELTYWAEGSPEHQLRRNTLDAIPTLYEDAFNDPGDGWEGSGALGHAVTSPGASPGPSPMSSPGQPPLSPGDPAHILHGASPGPSQKESGKASEDGSSIFSVKGISELP